MEWIIDHLVLCICLLAIVISLIAIAIILLKKKLSNGKDSFSKLQEYVDIFGGIDNIIEVKARESRLSLVLKDYDLINKEKLEEKGITSSIKMTNKITYVIGSLALEIEEYINSLKK